MGKGKKQFDWRAEESRDKSRAAMHESAHATIAHYFGVAWEANFIYCGVATADDNAWRGQLHFTAVPPMPPAFHVSCVCWGGVLSRAWDDSEGTPDAESLAWNARYLRDDMPDDVSATDERGICYHPQQWRACKTAARILIEHRAMWEWIAARMLDAGKVDCRETAQEWTRAGKRRTRRNHPCRDKARHAKTRLARS